MMEDYFGSLTREERAIFAAIANYAFSLGYKAKKDKTNAVGYTFRHNRLNKQILRFSNNRGKPIIRLKSFGSPAYSAFFHEAIRSTIEEYDFKYTGCYGCGNCDGTQGYTYKYPDGREYYRCGAELIEIADFRNVPPGEMIDFFRKQHEFFMSLP